VTANPSPRPAPRGNLVTLGLVQVVVAVTGIAIQIGLARFLGDDGYGSFKFLATLAGLLGFLADFSIPVLLARQVARAPENAAERLGTGLTAIALLAAPPILLTAAYAWLVDGRPDVVIAAFAAGATMGALATQGIGESIFQGLRRMRPLLWANLAGRLVYLGGTVWLLWLGWGVFGAFVAMAAGPLAAAAILLAAFRRQVGPPRSQGLAGAARLIRDGLPFGLHRAFMGAYLAGDVLVIQWFCTDAELGAYGAAALFLVQIPLAQVLIKAIYPTLSQAISRPDDAGAELGLAVRLLLVASLPIAVGGAMVAPELIALLFGPDFGAAVPLLVVLLPVLPLRFVNLTTGAALSALDRQPRRTRAILVIASFNLILNVLMVPYWGALGAAIATVIAEVALLIWLGTALTGAVHGVGWLSGVWRSLPGLLAMAGIVWLTGAAHVGVQIAAGAAVFAAAAWLMRAVTGEDLRRLLRL